MRAIVNFASEDLKGRIVPRVISGDIVVAVSMSEPAAGTALTDLTTRGRIDGTEIVLQGQKRWCSGGGHADAYIVYCRLDDQPGAAGIGAVLVEKERPGISFGRPELLMGFRGIPSSDIFLDDVRVPLDNLVVPAGGFRNLMEVFGLERCGNATMSLGIAAAALEEALAYVQERRQFGRPIVDFQAVQLKLAEMAMKVEAARLLIWRAAAAAGDRLPSTAHSSIAKCFANEIVREVTSIGLQLMGGYGYSTEYRMEQRVRDAYGWELPAAPSISRRSISRRRWSGGDSVSADRAPQSPLHRCGPSRRFLGAAGREPVPAQRQKPQPDAHDHDRCDVAARLAALSCQPPVRLRAAFGQHVLRQHPHGQPDESGQQDRVVDQSEHRDEVRNEVYRAQRIGDRNQADRLGKPRRGRIATGEPEHERVALDGACPGTQSFNRPHVAFLCAGWQRRHCVDCKTGTAYLIGLSREGLR